MADVKRVVVTGVGAIASTGNGIAENWDNISHGRSGIATITAFDPAGHKVTIAGEAKYDPTEYGFTPRDAQRYDRYVLHAVAAAEDAVQDSGIDFANRGDNTDVCAVSGTGIGGIINIQKTIKVLFEQGPARVTPFLVPSGTPEVASHTIAIKYGLHGASFGVNTACASANDAIADATRRLRYGPEVVAIAGGSEAPICSLSIATFGNMKALSHWDGDGDPTIVSRPFDKKRSGFVMGEGGGALILETLEHAKARGARIYAEVLGCGQTTDAYHVTAPDPSGTYISLAIQKALDDAKVNAEQIDYINAHGTSTRYNDLIETRAIKQVFGNHAKKLLVSSTKSMTGHLVGACGGIEAAFCIKAMEHGIVPPTINYEVPDDELDLNYVPNTAQEHSLEYVMSNNFGFGGHNAVILFKKFS